MTHDVSWGQLHKAWVHQQICKDLYTFWAHDPTPVGHVQADKTGRQLEEAEVAYRELIIRRSLG